MVENIHISAEALNEERFSRFELISWWDQEKLKNAKILVIGAGALGNEILKNLALLGVGNILVADMDRIENSNLSRSCLYRKEDNGKYKSEVASDSTRSIYPDINIHPFVGNVVHDLGRGAYYWADLIIGGLDNREARVSINSHSMFLKKTWIDGAIEILNGVARVFAPGGPCYECTMNETDWKMLEARRSCALLTRDEILQGKIPTTPTTASIIAGIQVQEAVKYIHGMEVAAGKGYIYSGLNLDTYITTYSRKQDCFAHDEYQELKELDYGTGDITVGDFLKKVRKEMGEETVIDLSRDLLHSLTCPSCNKREEIFLSLGKITEKGGMCKKCSVMRVPETLTTLGYDDSINNKTFKEIGVPLFDIINARSGMKIKSFLFGGDKKEILGNLN